MKKILSIIIMLSLVISTIGVIPGLAEDGVVITSGEDFINKVTKDGSYIIEGEEKLSDGSYGIIIPKEYVPLKNFGGSIKGIEGKNNIELTGKTLIDTVGTSKELTISDIVLKGYVNEVTEEKNTKGLGALIGTSGNKAILNISNVINYANVTYEGNSIWGVAGIVGSMFKSNLVNINNCKNHGAINSNSYFTAGILGYVRNSYKDSDLRIKNTYNYGNITSNSHGVAGVLGGQQDFYNEKKFEIANCGNYGRIESTISCWQQRLPAGIASKAGKIIISKCFNIGIITSKGAVSGIIVADTAEPINIEINDCFNAGDLSNASSSTGIIYENKKTVTVNNCYNVGDCKGNEIGTATYENTYKKGEIKENILPETFDKSVWEIYEIEGVEDYYKYPQIIGNTLFYDYKSFYDINNKTYVYPEFSKEKGKITGLTNYITEENIKENTDIYNPSEKGYMISSMYSYSGISGTTLIKTNEEKEDFQISKSAEVFIATDLDPKENEVTAVKEGGFSPVISEKTGKTEFILLKNGKKYYLSSKLYFVKDNPVTVSLGDKGNLTKMYGLFVKWLDNCNINIKIPENAALKVNDKEITEDLTEATLNGTSYKINIVPDKNYYIKSIKSNDDILFENIWEEKEINLILEKDTVITVEILPFTADFKEFNIKRTTNKDNTISQDFVISGNVNSFLKGGKIKAKITKDGFSVTGEDEIKEKGEFLITIPFDYDTATYNISLDVVKDSKTFNLTLPKDKETIEISSVKSTNELLKNLNDKTITENNLKESILNDKDLNFDNEIFKLLSESKKNNICKDILNYNGTYTVENVYKLYFDSLILNTFNKEENSSTIKKAIEKYGESNLNLNSSLIYDDYVKSSHKDFIYKKMCNANIETKEDILKQFEASVVLSELQSVNNSSGILVTLKKYKTVLDMEDIITKFDNMTDRKIKSASDYILKNINKINNKDDLYNKIDYAIKNAEKLADDKKPKPSGGGSGGGGSLPKREVEISFPEKDDKPKVIESTGIFNDISNVSWANDAINSMFSKGIISGREKGKFYPNDFITRAEFVKMIVGTFEFDNYGKDVFYMDVDKTSWAYPYIKKANANGIIKGITEDYFGANNNITREDMATILGRVIYRTSNHEILEKRIDINKILFEDEKDISSYAKQSVDLLSANGFIKGYEDNKFNPKNFSTRAEAVQMIYNVSKIINK